MAFDDRLTYLLLGMGIGFVLGYLVRLAREIKEELDEVKEEIESGEVPHKKPDELGIIKNPMTWAVGIVVLLTAWAAIVSQKASNDVQNAQDALQAAQIRQNQSALCTKKVLLDALGVLNERSTYTTSQIDSNLQLQKSFSNFLDLILHQPPFPEEKQLKAAQKYQESQHEFVDVSKKQKQKVVENPFPTDQDLDICLSQKH